MTEMSPETITGDEEVLAPAVVEELAPPAIEATVWRLGPQGMLISSVVERFAAQAAEGDKDAIYFYADLVESGLVKNDEETSQKVFRSLASVGLSEGQIINAVNRMQQDGILFRESAV